MWIPTHYMVWVIVKALTSTRHMLIWVHRLQWMCHCRSAQACIHRTYSLDELIPWSTHPAPWMTVQSSLSTNSRSHDDWDTRSPKPSVSVGENVPINVYYPTQHLPHANLNHWLTNLYMLICLTFMLIVEWSQLTDMSIVGVRWSKVKDRRNEVSLNQSQSKSWRPILRSLEHEVSSDSK